MIKRVTPSSTVPKTSAITASDEKESGTDTDYDGNITVTGDITAATAATLESTNGSVSLTGDLTANNGLAKITASDSSENGVDGVGDITVNGNVKAATTAEISTDQGNITVGTAAATAPSTTTAAPVTITSGSGLTVEATKSGDINVTGKLVTADDATVEGITTGDVNVKTAAGDIVLNYGTGDDKDVVNSSKAALVQTGAGDIDVTGNVIGATTATLDGKEGHVNLTGNLTANNGLAKIQAYDEAEAAESNDDGNITVKGNVVSDTDGVNITTTNGDITVGTAEATPGAVKAVKALGNFHRRNW